MFRKFGPNDIIRNTLVAHPKSNFIINESRVFYNQKPVQSGSFGADRNVSVPDTDRINLHLRPDGPLGMANLYEYNIDRAGPAALGDPSPNPYIYPVVTKNSSYASFKTVMGMSSSEYNNEFEFGDELTGSYPMTASIRRDYITTPSASSGVYNQYFMSLKNLLNLYGVRSQHYKVTSSYGDKSKQILNLIHIPSIFYGHRIKPGTLSLKWYYSGSLVGELRDTKQNGELIQVSGTYDGSGAPAHGANIGNVGGVAMYDEGLLLMTGSWDLSATVMHLRTQGGGTTPQWIYWGAGMFDGVNAGTVNNGAGSTTFRKASFELSFEGVTKTQALTLYAHAGKGQVNYSNNPTFVKHGQKQLEQTSSHIYEENSSRIVKNIVSSSYSNHSAAYSRQVYISKIAVYDDAKNLIGIATLANPILKEEEQDYTFKIKLDM
jgi:hypothetical protein